MNFNTIRFGFNLDQDGKTDSRNYVVGTDLEYEFIDGILFNLEIAHSRSDYDLTNSEYKSERRGNAYYFSIIGRFPSKKIIDTEYGFDGIVPEEGEEFFTKFRFFACRLDDEFDAGLSNYTETRDDEFWSRHIHFRKPFKYYYVGIYGEKLTFDDIKPYRIGNGIDIGRDVLGLRLETSWKERFENLFDLRNVHDTDGKYIETVVRDELTYRVSPKLTAKALYIYHHLPKTKGGIDPFVFNPQTGLNFDNIQIEDAKDPSVKTGSLGLEYKFFDWLAINGIWERTNDYSFGYENFPRGILNDGNLSYIVEYYGRRYRFMRNWLYGQEHFPKPPYPYYDIFKLGLRLNPIKNLEFYLDYTRNEYEKAGQIDDNINHFGLELSYIPTPKLNLFLKYTYSRWQDLDQLIQGITENFGHHNLFIELMYRKSKEEDIVFQFGEAGRDPIMGEIFTVGWDPYGGSLRVLDTQHIFRLYYRRRF